MHIPDEEAKAEAGWTPTPSPQPVEEEVTKGGSGELTQQGSSAASMYKSRVSGHLSYVDLETEHVAINQTCIPASS